MVFLLTCISDVCTRRVSCERRHQLVSGAADRGRPCASAAGLTHLRPSVGPSLRQPQGAMAPDTAKQKCRNFLATLLRLAKDQPDTVARNVRTLIQSLIDGRTEPEAFTTRLQQELNSSPQPCLVPFLKVGAVTSRPVLWCRPQAGQLSDRARCCVWGGGAG